MSAIIIGWLPYLVSGWFALSFVASPLLGHFLGAEASRQLKYPSAAAQRGGTIIKFRPLTPAGAPRAEKG